MHRQLQIISPDQIVLLRDCLVKARGGLRVYFQVVDDEFPYADYVADIGPQNNGLFDYNIGGHGIGSNTLDPVSLDSTIERILEQNGQFNEGGRFTLEVV
jgi:hypothetical protein